MNKIAEKAMGSAGAAVRALNPSVFQPQGKPLCEVFAAEGKRIRQRSGPLMNKFETEWFEVLRQSLPKGTKIHAQEWRVKISNGAWFKVDFCAVVNGTWTAWEVKGPKTGKNVDRGLLALKCACSAFPEVSWKLIWKENGSWLEQILLP
jgi:hypothetical protein